MHQVYRVTHKDSGKFYIGVHKTNVDDDGYMGSGRAIKAAIQKYGRAAFSKEILAVYEDKKAAYLEEERLTKDAFHLSSCFNMKIGGVGGWTLEAQKKGARVAHERGAHIKGMQRARELSVLFGDSDPKIAGSRGGLANRGKPKSAEHKAKIAESLRLRKFGLVS
jgi:hypothetical protein